MRISFLSLMTMFAVTNAAVVGLAEAQKSALEKLRVRDSETGCFKKRTGN